MLGQVCQHSLIKHNKVTFLICIIYIYRQNGPETMNIVYTRHHSSEGEETDYEVPQLKHRNIGFNKDTHPLSLMVY